jgi:hypothetical protein
MHGAGRGAADRLELWFRVVAALPKLSSKTLMCSTCSPSAEIQAEAAIAHRRLQPHARSVHCTALLRSLQACECVRGARVSS